MRLARLDTFVEIIGETEISRDEFNTPVMGEGVVATAWCERVLSSGREFLAADAIQAEQRAVFRTHWTDGFSGHGLNPANSLRCAGQTYNIREIRPIGRRRLMEIHAVGTVSR